MRSEGLALKNGSTFAYQYNLTDHLGNVRTVLNASKSVFKANHYLKFDSIESDILILTSMISW